MGKLQVNELTAQLEMAEAALAAAQAELQAKSDLVARLEEDLVAAEQQRHSARDAGLTGALEGVCCTLRLTALHCALPKQPTVSQVLRVATAPTTAITRCSKCSAASATASATR